MRRGVFDVLRRGLDNTIANWPLLLIRFAESVLFAIIAVVAAIVILAPILVSIGINIADLASVDDVENVYAILLSKWMMLVWIVAAVTVLLAVFVAVHSFVEAGSARVYVDGERIAGPEQMGVRSRFRVFSMQRWFAGAADGWWTVFWIYNLAWTVAGAILLIPLLPTLVLMLLLRDEQPLYAIATGCLGLAVTLLLFIAVAIVTTIWVNRAIAGWAMRRSGARDALAEGWRALRADLGRHVLIAVALYIVIMAGSGFFASFSLIASLGQTFGSDSGVAFLMTLPIRILGTLCSYAFTAGVTGWFLASYATLATDDSAR
ncbi:MAG TPA: hypothetical protein VE010_20725 [Thermoanaerobaculia bacterium]|nr:hypothetical protein [Thermoanaerobaculia bacterium]